MTEESAASGRTVISKAAAILMTFLDDGYVHTLTEIAAATGLPLSTAHRLARELVAWRILDRTEDGDYRVGLPLRLIGSVGGPGSTIEERAPLILQDLSYATGAEVRLGVLRDRAVAYIEKLPGRRPVSAFSSGAVLPAHATAMGKALLAFSPPEYVEMVVKRGLTSYTRYTLTAPDRFRRALAMTRLSRLAVSRWELRLDHSGLAVPVFGPGGQVAAALEVRVEDPAAELPTIRPALTIAGRSLTRELSATQGVRPREPGVHRVRPPGGNVRSLRPMDGAVRGSGRS
ncbi:IclR family transcriptional regulator [Pseudonocardia bannensis]|uniref:IclR family transcriptional regulator n=1 Tax=Pseudonocardia bannensis TaxID=630973 RepID=A0A848DDA1_9PSEU|nr:IclR family transcriptional regulator [Pseudonocardia bannensis]NMH90581.1 IclR family transcriptional regulator [Pseudonocardia bannensis]